MGIWKADATPPVYDPAIDSLPLMGIWKGEKAARASRLPYCSLPLMGIWKQVLELEVKAFLVVSLPLMGIWKLARRVMLAEPLDELITPHGDLEVRRRRCFPRQ